jgi:hypothetical protein
MNSSGLSIAGQRGTDGSEELLAALLLSPSSPAEELARRVIGSASEPERQAALAVVLRCVEGWKAKGGRGKKKAGAIGQRTAQLVACWRLLQEAEKRIKTKAQKVDPLKARARLPHLFAGLLGEAFPAEPGEPFLRALCQVLDVGTDGGFVAHYSAFLKNRPGDNPLPRLDRLERPQPDSIKRLLWWVIRRARVPYVRVEPVEIDRALLVEHVRGEFLRCLRKKPGDLSRLAELIDGQVEHWLSYSCLSGGAAGGPEELAEVARAFVACHQLHGASARDRLRAGGRQRPAEEGPPARSHRRQADAEVSGRTAAPPTAERLAHLEQQVERLADEVGKRHEEMRHLRDENHQLRAHRQRLEDAGCQLREDVERLQRENRRVEEQSACAPSPEAAPAEFRELRDFLLLIDGKYPLDTLQSVLAGAEPAITLKQFVGHFIYGLRKRGLGHYPDADEFDLDYGESGLYDCLGFEVEPGTTVRVAVQQKGWAFRQSRKLIPIRRARVRAAERPSGYPGRRTP